MAFASLVILARGQRVCVFGARLVMIFCGITYPISFAG
jgi:hypothetical protein